MKIMIIVASHGMGGLEKHCIDLANGLSQQPSLNVIFVGHSFYGDKLNSAVTFQKTDLSGSRLNPFTLLKLYRLIRNLKPDVVHAQANKAGYMLAKISGFIQSPCTLTVHGFKKKLPNTTAFKSMIAVSEKAKSRIKHANAQIIYNGIQPYKGEIYTKEQICEEFELASEKPLFIAVGRLAPVKRFDRLIHNWPEDSANLLIVGTGDLFESLHTQITKQGKEHAIKLSGQRHDVEALLSGSDICIFSSEREGFPYVFIESLLSHTPVISTPVSDFPSILPAFSLCQPDGTDLKELILNWVNNKTDLLQKYQPIFEFAEHNFTLDNMLQQHINHYHQLINTPLSND